MIEGKATIDYDGYELIVKFAPWRGDIVDELKSSIPQAYRAFRADTKAWHISTVYKQTVEEIFDVFDYAVRDYTGDDSAARMRQAGLRLEREQRQAEADDRAKRAEREQRNREEEAEKRRAKAERARTDDPWASEWHAHYEGDFNGFRGTEAPPNNDERTAQENLNDIWEEFVGRSQRNEASWREKFFKAMPFTTEMEFKLWYSWYITYGRDTANQKFKTYWDGKTGKSKKTAPPKPKTLDPYRVLGIVGTTPEGAAKNAYRELAKKWHPDLNPGDAEALDRMKKINAAWDHICAERGW